MSKANQDNRSNQLNDNNDAYWKGRGYDNRPQPNNTSDYEWEDYHEFNDIKGDS